MLLVRRPDVGFQLSIPAGFGGIATPSQTRGLRHITGEINQPRSRNTRSAIIRGGWLTIRLAVNHLAHGGPRAKRKTR